MKKSYLHLAIIGISSAVIGAIIAIQLHSTNTPISSFINVSLIILLSIFLIAIIFGFKSIYMCKKREGKKTILYSLFHIETDEEEEDDESHQVSGRG